MRYIYDLNNFDYIGETSDINIENATDIAPDLSDTSKIARFSLADNKWVYFKNPTLDIDYDIPYQINLGSYAKNPSGLRVDPEYLSEYDSEGNPISHTKEELLGHITLEYKTIAL